MLVDRLVVFHTWLWQNEIKYFDRRRSWTCLAGQSLYLRHLHFGQERSFLYWKLSKLTHLTAFEDVVELFCIQLAVDRNQ